MYEQYIELVWFFVGVFSYRIATVMFSYSHMAQTIQNFNEQSLKMLGTVAEDVGFIRAIKYSYMVDSGLNDEQIKQIKDIDDRAFFMWKNTCVAHMLSNCPRNFRNYLKYHDWASAMKELDKLYKTEAKRKKS